MPIRENSQLEQVKINNEVFYKISNINDMRPFFMSIVSDSNHWMFIGSNGGLSAGRKDAENALFPYYTDDKIIESVENTGSKSIFQVNRGDKSFVWEPFSIRNAAQYSISRNLYKNVYGNKVLFEEINHDLNLTYQYQWNSSNLFGFVKKGHLINENTDSVGITLLDGLQNILPYHVGVDLQSQRSNLVDAYKRNELEKESGIGIFALSAIIVDKAEPSEALKANIAWSLGFNDSKHLLSSLQLDNFRNGLHIQEEYDIKAERGSYFISSEFTLASKAKRDWMIIANINQNINSIVKLSQAIQNDPEIIEKVENDIALGTKKLIELNAATDGLQLTQDNIRDTRHFANSLFNIMRGGIFDNNYLLEKSDVLDYFQKANREVFQSCLQSIQELPDQFTLTSFKELASKSDDKNFIRLCIEYLPLKFSRRHGDPSRPWNQFSINTHDENTGAKILDYQGNWRDIFQNWEALVHSYPEFIEGMIHKFLNATTFDGYNPYRITKDGIDWERIEADDPWSYIGYWGDHQIIYLLKLLEFAEKHNPGKLNDYFDQSIFVHANVPYKIKSYKETLANPKDTIDFDHALDNKIAALKSSIGADGTLLQDKNGTIIQVNFIEKILATVLAKMSNFIPEGGIWMNTQRPEWNDANNALVGNGVSMVTLSYLRRFLKFFDGLLGKTNIEEVNISEEQYTFFKKMVETLDENQEILSGKITDKHRKLILDGLGLAASTYRLQIYNQSYDGKSKALSITELRQFVNLSLTYLEHTINANKRDDSLYHAYNLMTLENEQEISISYLSEMLEGQVAVLSSGYLSSEETLSVLDSLKHSALFRADQYSYLLYPNKDLSGFMQKNNIPENDVAKSNLLTQLLADNNSQIIEKDVKGSYHFKSSFHNSGDVKSALSKLDGSKYANLINSDSVIILQIFEKVFNHKAFTGRSGTFFGYEGLGSIYWHMVSKLQLAVQECCLKAIEDQENEELVGRLLEHYYEINEGIGIHKSPTLYGAFPTDPYSHTPEGKGAQQPGMTGQVKEDILSRFGELGVFVKEGKLTFNPCLLRKDEFLTIPTEFNYVDVSGQWQKIEIEKGSLAFTYCQIPIVYKLDNKNQLEILLKDSNSLKLDGLSLNLPMSQKIFQRDDYIIKIIVNVKESMLR